MSATRLVRFALCLLAASHAAAITFTVTSTADSGPGTLRQAILDANAAAGADRILFSVAAVNATSSLPAITDVTEVDGTTATGRVEIVRTAPPDNTSTGLTIGADGSSLHDVVVSGFRRGVLCSGSDISVFRSRIHGSSAALMVGGTGTVIHDNVVSGALKVVVGNGIGVFRNSISAVEVTSSTDTRIGAPGMGNDIRGIRVTGSTGTIIEQNTISVVSAHGRTGVLLSNTPVTPHTVIRGNSISGFTTGITALTSSSIGRNTFRNNGRGVLVQALGVTLTGNSFLANGFPIDLNEDGPTPNDPAPDADMGGNRLQNYPILTSATVTNGTLGVQGMLTSQPVTSYVIELFDSSASDPEAERLLDRFEITTDATGNAAFTRGGLPALGTIRAVTATATNIATGDTSEISPAVVRAGDAAMVPSLGLWGVVALAAALAAVSLTRIAQ